jgi:hypothetical protein
MEKISEKLKAEYISLYEMYGQINIKCSAADSIPISSIMDFQGKLKKRTDQSKIKLAKQIFTKGFIAPIFVWKNNDTFYNLDGHGRTEVLIEMEQSGVPIPDLFPVAYIEADNVQDAKEKLLSISSQYGEFDIVELESWLMDIDDGIKDTLRFVDKELRIKMADSITDFPDLKDGDRDKFQQMTFFLSDKQAVAVKKAIDSAKETLKKTFKNKNSNGNALYKICKGYLNGNQSKEHPDPANKT